MATTHPSRLVYADQTNCASPSSEITESGLRNNLLVVMDAQAFNCEKKQRTDAFAGGANTHSRFVSGKYSVRLFGHVQLESCGALSCGHRDKREHVSTRQLVFSPPAPSALPGTHIVKINTPKIDKIVKVEINLLVFSFMHLGQVSSNLSKIGLEI